MSDDRGARLGYRPALDGYRAVAVMAVFAYHLGYRWLPGGFLGVDLFFVLSGYLITSLLLAEWEETGRISLGVFWLRRARRLLPALLLLLIAIACRLRAVTPTVELALRRRDMLWTLFYGANWHFIATSQDYFAQSASASPLLHTWSLAIEEQFYVVWPLIVVAVATIARGRRGAIAALAAVGIVVSAIAAAMLFTPGDPSRAYYGTDTRAFEPLAGALLAAMTTGACPRWLTRIAPLLGALAAAVVAAAFLRLDAKNPIYYHGVALAFTAAAAVFIWALDAAPSAWMARALAWNPVRWVGQISYGVYLWHWPIIQSVSLNPTGLSRLPGSTGVNLTRILITVGIATASFYCLEQPLRRGRISWRGLSRVRRRLLAGTAVAAAAGLAIWVAVIPASATSDIPECLPGPETICLRAEAGRGAPVLVVVGDSIARSLDQAFLAIARERGWTYVMAASNGCRLSHELTVHDGQPNAADTDCYEKTPAKLDRVVTEWNPALVVAMDRWEMIDVVGPGGNLVSSATPAHVAMTEAGLTDVAARLTSRGAHLAFIELPPILPGSCGAPSMRNAPNCRRPVASDVEQAPYNAIFRHVAARVPGVSTLSITNVVCPDGVCPWTLGGRVLRSDGKHFTREAATWLAPTILQRLPAPASASARGTSLN